MNRGSQTYGKLSRRVRLWLTPETWSYLDRSAAELYWDSRAPTVIESLLENCRRVELNRANRAAEHPVEAEPDDLPF
jgi:hypothetical protein